jgi:hypothetical protein
MNPTSWTGARAAVAALAAALAALALASCHETSPFHVCDRVDCGTGRCVAGDGGQVCVCDPGSHLVGQHCEPDPGADADADADSDADTDADDDGDGDDGGVSFCVGRDCEDDNPCTDNSCDEENDRCVSEPAVEDTPCPGVFFCRVETTCGADGRCDDETGSARDCADAFSCTEDRCSEVDRACYPQPNHASCVEADRNFCDPGAAGRDPVTGCAPHPCTDPSDCNDGFHCNGVELCDMLQCAAGTPPDCDDHYSCTDDACSEAAHDCRYTRVVERCDDLEFCTVDVCDPENSEADGVTGCVHAPEPCEDGFGCTEDACREADDTCLHVPIDGFCDDVDPCTGIETCDVDTGCLAGTPLVCDDGQPCNGIETCAPGVGCQEGTTSTCNKASPDGCCQDGCTIATDHDCCEAAGCEDRAPDACCPSYCAVGDDPDCCALSYACVEPHPNGCCPPTCTIENDTDCCGAADCSGAVRDFCCPRPDCEPFPGDVDC